MEKFNFEIIAGSSPILRFRLKVPENVTDWTTVLYVKDKTTGNVALQIDGALADSTQVPDAATVGVFDITLSRTQTLALIRTNYDFAFWRTNMGFEDPLVSGVLTVKQVAPE